MAGSRRSDYGREERIPVLQVRETTAPMFIYPGSIEYDANSSISIYFPLCKCTAKTVFCIKCAQKPKKGKGKDADGELGVEYTQYGFDMQFLRRYEN